MKSVSRVVFVGSLEQEGCSGGQRLWALRQNQLDVKVVDKSIYQKKASRFHGLMARLLHKPLMLVEHAGLAEDFLRCCEEHQPDLVWMEWAREFLPSTMEAARKLLPAARFVSMQDDNPWGLREGDKWIWRHYFPIVPHFDLHLVKREEDKRHLESIGALVCRKWEHGIYSPDFFPKAGNSKCYPVSFVGTCMDGRDELVRILLEAGIDLHVFGTHWSKRSDLPKRFPANFHSAVRGEAYAEVIRNSWICLGLVSKSNKDEWTMRSYEVPGCGGLLLAERTPTHERMFEEGREAEFFSSPEQCVEKIRLLLSDLDRCASMGVAARDRFIERGWTLEARMRELLEQIA